ncbi:hypothetical protein B0F90DRAFT_1685193 [Multifurca ochricompacta]|uniref:Uncharacterized protein n=1 Tax=Multifurca ochricompacta TaxID=376703 RepID=A0AAD4QPP8_9AGAM|nr:hypothetical protein B0F90DRAFT_1685193 [Multifurca ochricompacta]
MQEEEEIHYSSKRFQHIDSNNSFHTPPLIYLNTRLQNIGSRIRRSVSEGYATHRFSHLSTSSRDLSSSIKDLPIFRSSNDTLHAVYSQLPSSHFPPSDRKRVRMEFAVDEYEEFHNGGNAGKDDGPSEPAMQSASVIAANDLASPRPMKPLRRTPRMFGQTKSLPAAAFGSLRNDLDRATLDTGLQEGEEEGEEEDWSTAAFSGDPLKTTTVTKSLT